MYPLKLSAYPTTYTVYKIEKERQYTRNIKLRRLRVKHCDVFRVFVYRFWYPTCNAHAAYYIDFCGLQSSTIFSHNIL